MRVQTLVTSQVVKEPKQDLNVLPVSNLLVCAVISRILLQGSSRAAVDEVSTQGCVVLLLAPRREPREAKSMVGLGGLEPPTSPLSGARSNHLSYRPGQLSQSLGGADRDRTDDPLLAKQVLSQLSYSPEGITNSSGCRCLVWTPWNESMSFSKGGDPAAPSDTATLLRLHPSH